MINIRGLAEKDIGRRVKCSMYKGIENFGKIKNWDDNFIYIIYDDWCSDEGEPVYPKYLTFVEEYN